MISNNANTSHLKPDCNLWNSPHSCQAIFTANAALKAHIVQIGNYHQTRIFNSKIEPQNSLARTYSNTVLAVAFRYKTLIAEKQPVS